MQEEGRSLRREDETTRRRVFQEGDTLEGEEEEPEVVVVEVDGTMLSSQEKGGERFEVKLGLLYTGKGLESEGAKWKRYGLKEKVLYGGVEEGDALGQKLYLRGEGQSISSSWGMGLDGSTR